MFPTADDVVITGIGCVGPLGADRETFWQRLLAGDRGIRRLDGADFHGLPLFDQPGVPPIGAPTVLPSGATSREPVLQLILASAAEAADHARLSPGGFDPDRAGCVIGTSKGGLVTFARAFAARRDDGSEAAGWTAFPPHTGSTAVARRLGLRGPCLAPVAACATGLVSVLRGFDLIREGVCDLVVAGSGDASLHPAVLASFRRMGVLASRFNDAAAACRPFNTDRDGFAVGEGAAAFVLERRSHAAARGVRPVATVAGGAVLSDPSGLTAVDPSGETLARAITDTLDRARLSPRDIGHVNLHGTATRFNDLAETAGLRRSLGRHVEAVRCVALKGSIGHQLGAAGATELAATALAVRDGRLPPTVNLTNPDPACRLPLSRESVPVTGWGLKVSLGFGGHVAVACLGPEGAS